MKLLAVNPMLIVIIMCVTLFLFSSSKLTFVVDSYMYESLGLFNAINL